MKASELRDVVAEVLQRFGDVDIVIISEGPEEKMTVQTLELIAATVDGREVLAFVTGEIGDTTGSSSASPAH